MGFVSFASPFNRTAVAEQGGGGEQTLLRTYTATNTSGSEQAAGSVLKPFGVTLPPGALADADWPLIKVDGTEATCSIGCRSSWSSDDSWAYFVALVRLPVAIAGSSAVDIEVFTGGSEPAAASVDATDLAADDWNLVVDGVTNLTGEWTAALNDGDVTVVLDGPAGQIVKVDVDLEQSATPQGHLWSRFYVQILQDGSAGLAGTRILPRLINGKATGTGANRRVVNAEFFRGATSIRAMTGYDDGYTTVSADINMAHAAGFFVCDTDGEYHFDAGTQAADDTIVVTFDAAEEIATGFHPPYDLSLSPSDNASYDYVANTSGPVTRAMGSAGERDDIAWYPTWLAKYFYNQSADDRRALRVLGLVPSSWRTCYRDTTYLQILPLNNGGQLGGTGGYANMATPDPAAQTGASSSFANVASPTTNNSSWSSEDETSHRPSLSYLPYIVTGRPEYLDLLQEYANTGMGHHAPGLATWNTALDADPFPETGRHAYQINNTGTAYYGVTTMIPTIPRTPAWLTRDWVQAYRATPDDHPAKQYITDCLTDGVALVNAFNAAQGATWNAQGMVCNANYVDSSSGREISQHALNHLLVAYAAIYPMTRWTAAATLRDHVAKQFSALPAGIHRAGAFGGFNRLARGMDGVMVDSLADSAFALANTSVSWDSGTDIFTLGGANAVVPTDGDLFGFWTYHSVNKPFTAGDYELFEVINAGIGGNAQQFQLADRGSGTPKNVTTTASVTTIWARTANAPPEGSYGDSGHEYLMEALVCATWLDAGGASGMSAAITELRASRTTALTSESWTMAQDDRIRWATIETAF